MILVPVGIVGTGNKSVLHVERTSYYLVDLPTAAIIMAGMATHYDCVTVVGILQVLGAPFELATKSDQRRKPIYRNGVKSQCQSTWQDVPLPICQHV
jgi:hypothetical protein